MLKKTILLLCTVIITVSFSCQKPSLLWKKATGTVIWTGYVDVDGCGYKIKIKDKFYKPVNLSKEFEQDLLKIKFKYKHSNEEFTCSFNKQETIEIKDIEYATN